MKRISRYTKRTVWFRHWNRAGYSAFMSLGKQIAISSLHCDVADALLRDKHLRRMLLTESLIQTSESEEFADEDSKELSITDLLAQTATLYIVTSKSEVLPESNYLYFLTINPIHFFMKQIGFFICMYYEKNLLDF
ncbi:MAG: hypothetical protein MJ198_10335 [Bacteroidales bacterium]|nr:hypothetical protein [Bacteroidales bacterium]